MAAVLASRAGEGCFLTLVNHPSDVGTTGDLSGTTSLGTTGRRVGKKVKVHKRSVPPFATLPELKATVRDAALEYARLAGVRGAEDVEASPFAATMASIRTGLLAATGGTAGQLQGKARTMAAIADEGNALHTCPLNQCTLPHCTWC